MEFTVQPRTDLENPITKDTGYIRYDFVVLEDGFPTNNVYALVNATTGCITIHDDGYDTQLTGVEMLRDGYTAETVRRVVVDQLTKLAML